MVNIKPRQRISWGNRVAIEEGNLQFGANKIECESKINISGVPISFYVQSLKCNDIPSNQYSIRFTLNSKNFEGKTEDINKIIHCIKKASSRHPNTKFDVLIPNFHTTNVEEISFIINDVIKNYKNIIRARRTTAPRKIVSIPENVVKARQNSLFSPLLATRPMAIQSRSGLDRGQLIKTNTTLPGQTIPLKRDDHPKVTTPPFTSKRVRTLAPTQNPKRAPEDDLIIDLS